MPEVDAVFIGTPNRFTPGAVIAALDAGKHVFCPRSHPQAAGGYPGHIGGGAAQPGPQAEVWLQSPLSRGHPGGQADHRWRAPWQDSLDARHLTESRAGGLREREWRSNKELVGAGILLESGHPHAGISSASSAVTSSK